MNSLVTLGKWDTTNGFSIMDSVIVSIIAIIIVFAVLTILIFITEGVNSAANGIAGLTAINAREENKILDEDEDAAVAVLVATIDFNKETGKNANVVSVTKIED